MNARTNRKELKTIDDSNKELSQAVTPADQYFNMVNMAMRNGDLEQVRQMMEMKREFETDEARKEFYKSFAEFKANAPIVTKDMKNSQYGNAPYTSRGHLVNTVSPALSKYGLSTRWDILEQTADSITISCILTHSLGHSISVRMTAPPDRGAKNQKGNYGKNEIQAIKSTKTYLEVSTFESVTGVATSNYGDDDGQSAYKPEKKELISKDQANEIWAYATENKIEGNLDRLLKGWTLKKVEDIWSENFDYVVSTLKQAVEAQ